MYFLLRFLSILLMCACLLACSSQKIEGTASTHPLSEIEVPPGYEVEIAAGPDLVDYPMFATLDEMGRLFVFESVGNVYENSQEAIDTPQFRITLLRDVNGDGIYDKRTVFADSLSFPQGGVFYQGSLYASSAPDLLKLTDTDGDDVADKREVILSGWVLNVNANSLVGPYMGPDGWLYMTSAIMGFDVTSQEGERMKGETARIWRVRPDGSDLEWISAGGMNNPVALAFTGGGEVLGTQTFFIEPKRGLRDALTYWTEGGIYGKQNTNITRDQLPLTGELMPVVSSYSRVAPAGMGAYRGTALGADFQHNLFTTQFNTHRLVRHKLIREGATFRTEDEVFLSSPNQDFHPTDVLEDADGSLLMVETGGWFILGCPLSQVSKPQLEGSIYRIRKKGKQVPEDPYGNAINWEQADIQSLAGYCTDERLFVRDRAFAKLVEHGAKALPALSDMIRASATEEIRTRTLFACYQIGGAEALAAIRSALDDKSEQVRIVAARCVGMAEDRKAVEVLIELLADASMAVRRQAATALGQLADTRAVGPLLEAAGNEPDRFAEHAILHALHQIGNTPELVKGLDHPNPAVQRIALIALDQQQPSAIRVKQLSPFLRHPSETLRQTALWVVGHHPEWVGSMQTYLASRFNNFSTEGEEAPLLGQVLQAFCGDPDMQAFMASQLLKGDESFRQFLLNNMKTCEADFPDTWTQALKRLLHQSTSPDLLSQVVELVRLRKVAALQPQLQDIAQHSDHAAPLRIQAIGTLLEFDTTLSDTHFEYVFTQLRESSESALQQQISLTLSRASLSEAQLTQIAIDYLPDATAFMLPRIAPLFEGAYSLPTGEALIAALTGSPVLGTFSPEQIQEIFANYPSDIQPKVEELLVELEQARAGRLERLEDLLAKAEQGDEARGRALYFGKATCWTCHTMGEKGGNLGPDLTSIQQDRSPHDLLEAILYPSASFVREYETYQIRTADQTLTGIIRSQSPEILEIGIGPNASVRLARKDILDIQQTEISLMPGGFGELLEEHELVDLLAFLVAEDLVYW